MFIIVTLGGRDGSMAAWSTRLLDGQSWQKPPKWRSRNISQKAKHDTSHYEDSQKNSTAESLAFSQFVCCCQSILFMIL